MKNLLWLCFFLVLSSCNTEQLEEEILPVSPEKMGPSLGPAPSLENVFVALVREEACSAQRFEYSIYASSSETHTKDREIQAGVVKNGGFIAAKILTIPAGKTVSNNVLVFTAASESYGSVVSRAYNVLIDGEIVNDYSFPSIYDNVQNCYTPSFGANCYEGIFEEDNPNTAVNEGPGDQDDDGICNDQDIDDNDNDIPDEWEDV